MSPPELRRPPAGTEGQTSQRRGGRGDGRSVSSSAHKLLRDSLASGDTATAQLVAWLLGRAA